MTNEERTAHLEAMFACKTVSECSAFFVRDCIRRAKELTRRVNAGEVLAHQMRAVTVRIETLLAEAEEEMKNA